MMGEKTRKNINQGKTNRFWTGVPPWIIIGAVAILLPIFAVLTAENINRQKINSITLLREKGAALIRSFEAGTRTGLLETYWKSFQLQNLLMETAQQPDIVYILVTDAEGVILAHNNPNRIGMPYGQDLDLEGISRLETVHWRVVSESHGIRLFEVFRKFSPAGSRTGLQSYPTMHHRLFRKRMGDREKITQPPYVIFVGLDMASIEEARKADTRHTLIMAAILLLIGFAGIFLLFLAQSYRSTKASLSRIKAFSDSLVENMPVGLLAIDGNKKIASINPAAGSILKMKDHDVLGKDAGQVLPGELQRILEDLDASDIDAMDKDIECIVGNQPAVPVEVSASLLYEDDGSPGYLLLLRDLREVYALRKEVARNQRLASVGRLAAGVAHEVRNPLSSIKGFATYFKERYRDIPEDQQISNIMIQEVDRLNRVVGQLLEFARPVAISKKRISVKPFIEDSLKLIEKQASEKHITLLTGFSPDIDMGFFDPDRISQVLLNLYLNATESMEEGGKIWISTSPNEEKNGLDIKIVDTGVGISEADLIHVFDPYFTTKATGTGLGLAIANNIMEAHGGHIRVESRKGQGTTVTVHLPGQ